MLDQARFLARVPHSVRTISHQTPQHPEARPSFFLSHFIFLFPALFLSPRVFSFKGLLLFKNARLSAASPHSRMPPFSSLFKYDTSPVHSPHFAMELRVRGYTGSSVRRQSFVFSVAAFEKWRVAAGEERGGVRNELCLRKGYPCRVPSYPPYVKRLICLREERGEEVVPSCLNPVACCDRLPEFGAFEVP